MQKLHEIQECRLLFSWEPSLQLSLRLRSVCIDYVRVRDPRSSVSYCTIYTAPQDFAVIDMLIGGQQRGTRLHQAGGQAPVEPQVIAPLEAEGDALAREAELACPFV